MASLNTCLPRAVAGLGRLGKPIAPFAPRPFQVKQGILLARSQPEGSNQTPTTPQATKEDLPPWVRREKEREFQAQQAASGGFQLPWGLALLFSVLVAIAATGSIFEFIDKNPVFGVIQPDNPLWAPILLFMAITGYPVAGFLFKFGVDKFNEAAELQDRMDGYLPDDRK